MTFLVLTLFAKIIVLPNPSPDPNPQAWEMDVKANSEGVEAIAPFYGLPIPMKGTASVVDYPSGSGVGVLSGYAAKAWP